MTSVDEATPLIYRDEDDDSDGSTLSDGTKAKRDITTWQLVVIIYFCVSGGPFGNEDAVQAGGVAWCLAITALSSFIFNIPMALGVAELASAMPENGGFIVWVNRAFGPVAGFLQGYTAWASDVFDNSLYPVLFSTYLETAIYGTNDVWPQGIRYLVRFSVVGLCTICNILGLQAVGTISLIFTVITLAPFAFMCFYSIPELEPKRWITFEDSNSVHWGLLLSTVLWANSGWDAPGTVAGCVYKPKETYPRAVFIAVLLVLATNFFPIAVGSAYLQDRSDWDTTSGFWAFLGDLVAGKWLAWAIIISGIVSNLALLNVCLATTAWGLYAICLPGLLDIPSVTTIHERLRTPFVSIALNATAVALGCFFDFSFLVQIDQTLCCFSLILGDFALIWLRVAEPNKERPFRIPLGTIPLALFMLPHIIVCAALGFYIDKEAQMIVVVTMVLGGLVYGFCRYYASQKEKDLFPVKDIGKVFDNIPQCLEERYGTVVKEEDLPDLGLATSVVVETIPVPVALDVPSAEPRSDVDEEEVKDSSSESVPLLKQEGGEDESGELKKKVTFEDSTLPLETTENNPTDGLNGVTEEKTNNPTEEKFATPVKKPSEPSPNTGRRSIPVTPYYRGVVIETPHGQKVVSPPGGGAAEKLESLPFTLPEVGISSPTRSEDGIPGQSKRSISRRRRVKRKSLFVQTQNEAECTTPESEKDAESKQVEEGQSGGEKGAPTNNTTTTMTAGEPKQRRRKEKRDR